VTTVGTLLIRADASVATGTGHVMRCLALAQAWQDTGGRTVFASAEITDALRKRLGAESCDLAVISSPGSSADDAARTVTLAQENKCDWVIVDAYAFGSQYQRALKAAGLKALFVDDRGHASPYSADVVLNQNVSATRELYADRSNQTRLLLGTRYSLLRREFTAWRDWQREISRVGRRLLVLMGGSDPGNFTARVLEALAVPEFAELEATVVIGGSNPNYAMLENLASSRNIALKRDVANVAELMSGADVAISASGATCWELCFMGLPSLLVDAADNQKPLAQELDRRGCAIHVGDSMVTSAVIAKNLNELISSFELRQSLSRQSRALVDGYGAARIVSVLRGAPSFRLRRVCADDARLLWEWANDPDVRAASFSSAPIPWEEHVKWLSAKLGCKKSLFLIVEEENGSKVGQVRFDLDGGDAVLSFSIAKEKRGFGLASPVIEAAVQELWLNSEAGRVHAFVKPENVPSVKMVENAGFDRVGEDEVRRSGAIEFVRARK
jgi:UDP-2,4-diacetamido-2,4,6-trideoxy-beta-L-altropyranose hydrolase